METQSRGSDVGVLAAEALDGLAANIAVVDKVGRILAVNAAWCRFAEANGLRVPHRGVGRNYLEIGTAAAAAGCEDAAAVAEGLRAVLAGDRAEFRHVYPSRGRTTAWPPVRRSASAGSPAGTSAGRSSSMRT